MRVTDLRTCDAASYDEEVRLQYRKLHLTLYIVDDWARKPHL